MKKNTVWQMVKFTLFSASAGIIEVLAFTLLNELFRWRYWPAYLTALVLSVLWNFTLNRRFTFQSAANVPVAMAKVFGFYAVFTPPVHMAGSSGGEQRNQRIYCAGGDDDRKFCTGISLLQAGSLPRAGE